MTRMRHRVSIASTNLGSRSYCSQASHLSSNIWAVQDEFARVLYPLFVHCYLELITKRATSEAHRLLTKQKQRFTSSGAQNAQIRQQVCTLSSLQHLAST